MSRSAVTVTTSWALVASAVVTITVREFGNGVLMINDESVDATAEVYDMIKRERVQQNANKPTYLKATGTGWVVIIDTP